MVGAGVAGAGEDRTSQGLRGVERGDADGTVDQLGLGVEVLLAGIDLRRRDGAGSALCAAIAVSNTFSPLWTSAVDGVDHRVGQHHRSLTRLRRAWSVQ